MTQEGLDSFLRKNGGGEIRGWHQGTGAATVQQALTFSPGNSNAERKLVTWVVHHGY